MCKGVDWHRWRPQLESWRPVSIPLCYDEPRMDIMLDENRAEYIERRAYTTMSLDCRILYLGVLWSWLTILLISCS